MDRKITKNIINPDLKTECFEKTGDNTINNINSEIKKSVNILESLGVNAKLAESYYKTQIADIISKAPTEAVEGLKVLVKTLSDKNFPND